MKHERVFHIVMMMVTAAGAVLITAGLNGMLQGQEHCRDTVRDTVWSTYTVREPAVHDTVRLYTRLEKLPRVERCGDTVRVCDTVLVQVERVQVHYADSMYDAWVSGVDPRLDSVRLHMPEYRMTVTEQVKVPKPRRRLGIGPQVGYGWNGREYGPSFGIGIQYDLIVF